MRRSALSDFRPIAFSKPVLRLSRTLSKMVATTPRLKARPMHSRSKPFEAGYARFIAEVFERGISSVSREETPSHRALVLAGCHRIVRSNRTGLLQFQVLDLATGVWRRGSTGFLSTFWAKNSDIIAGLRSAWIHRVSSHIPDETACFPRLTKVQQAKGKTAESLRDEHIRMAAGRRLATGAVREAAKRTFVSGLWNFLVDREALTLCLAIFGRDADFTEYNYTVQHREALAARARETPNLTPLIGDYLHWEKALAHKKAPASNVIALARAQLFDCRAEVDGGMLGRDPWIPPEAISPQGWRYLTTLTRTAIEHLRRTAGQSFFYGESLPYPRLSRALNLIARTGERPPVTFLVWWVTALGRLERATSAHADIAPSMESLSRLLRLAAAQARLAAKRGQLTRFVKGDLALVWDWFRGDETRGNPTHLANVRSLAKGVTWASLMRTQHAWHIAAEARAEAQRAADRAAYARYRAGLRARTWGSLVGKCVIDEVAVLPLTSGKALQAEGRHMGHCVGGYRYIEDCTAGDIRIFSLRADTSRATVELYAEGKHLWKVGQVFGSGNTPMPKAMWAVASQVAKQYSAASRESSAKEKQSPETLPE